jgi:acetyl esterase/lipase
LELLGSVDLTVTRDGLQRMAADYLGGADPRDPLASPVFGDFSGLPPLLVIVGGHEGLLDDGVSLARQAAIAGVDVTLRIWAGMQHVFPLYAGFLPEADAAIAVIGSWIAARLGTISVAGTGGHPRRAARARAARP